MNISEPFIRRPVATTLFTAGIVFAGLAAYYELPVSPLPQIDQPTIQQDADNIQADYLIKISISNPVESLRNE